MKRLAIAILIAIAVTPARAQLLPQTALRPVGYARIYRGDAPAPRRILLAQASGAASGSPMSPAPAASAAHYAGKLDLATNPTFEPMVMRELNDGMWLMGMQTTLWHLERTSDGAEIVHVGAFWVTRPEGTDTAYGINGGANIGPALRSTIGQVAAVADSLANLPPFVAKIASVTSIEGDAGYRPHTSADDHHLIYGLSGKVTVKFSDLSCWIMKSCPGSTGL